MNWKIPVGILALGGLGGAAYLTPATKPYVLDAVQAVRHLRRDTATPSEPAPRAGAYDFPAESRWNGLIPLRPVEEKAIGMQFVTVEAQREPMRLNVNGTTAYDEESLTQVRTRFDSVVTRVYKSLGDPVKKGDPLVELFSNDLAKAKNDLQVQYVEWLHDARIKEARGRLFQKQAISELQWIETQNTEAKSHLDYILARNNLRIYGLPEEEIDALLTGLDGESLKVIRDQDVQQKASMTLRAKANGFVVKKDVVPGNLYQSTDVLMVIAPLDHLRVYGNVYESDIEDVRLNQDVEVAFPYQDRTVRSTVENISSQVNPETHALRIRTTIQNPGGQLKADMLVRMVVEIKPIKGSTVIDRNAVVTSFGKYYVFVRKSKGDPGKSGPDGKQRPDLFERREVVLKQERSDRVIVARGLQVGDEVATNGSLILAQMYEDLYTLDTGKPL